MSENLTIDAEVDPRVGEILKAGFDAFRQYGFRRTSMDDIARGAGVSRSALYQHFRNKQDVFQSLVSYYFDTAEAAMAAAFRQTGPAGDVLAEAFLAKGGAAMRALLESPHGAEFLDVKARVSGEIVEAGEARLVAVIAGWLNRETAAGHIVLPQSATPHDLAGVMFAALNGVKSDGMSYDAYLAAVRLLGQTFGRALRP